MTIGTNNRNDAVGNDSTPTYSYGFKIFAATDLRVTVRNVSTGAETLLSYPGQYSVSGVGLAAGGSITLANVAGAWQNADGTLKTGYAITIRRVVTVSQQTDIRNQGDFFASVHEDTFDFQSMVDQQQQDEIDRSIKLPESEDGSAATTILPAAAQRASKIAGWDASGNLIALTPFSPGVLSVSAFIETLLDDASAAAARATLLVDTVSSVASASSPDIWTGTGLSINLTGTTTVTGFANAPQAGARRTLVTAAAVAFTAGANLLIPGVVSGQNFNAAANTRLEVIAISTTQFLLTPMTRAVSETKTLSGTAVDFTGIPPWVTKITGTIVAGSMDNNLTHWLIKLGDAGGIESAGYTDAFAEPVVGGTRRSDTTGFPICGDQATSGAAHIEFTLLLHERATNTWIIRGSSYSTNTGASAISLGNKALSDTLTQLRLTTTAALDNFDAGKLTITYE